MKTIQQISEQTLAIENFLKTRLPGEELTYFFIESETGVPMDVKGKGYLRSALRRLKLPFETFKGQGVRLLCADNATRIVAHKTIKIDNATKRAEKTTLQVIHHDSFEQVSDENKQRINGIASLFATIRLFSTNAKKIFTQQKIKIGERHK